MSCKKLNNKFFYMVFWTGLLLGQMAPLLAQDKKPGKKNELLPPLHPTKKGAVVAPAKVKAKLSNGKSADELANIFLENMDDGRGPWKLMLMPKKQYNNQRKKYLFETFDYIERQQDKIYHNLLSEGKSNHYIHRKESKLRFPLHFIINSAGELKIYVNFKKKGFIGNGAFKRADKTVDYCTGDVLANVVMFAPHFPLDTAAAEFALMLKEINFLQLLKGQIGVAGLNNYGEYTGNRKINGVKVAGRKIAFQQVLAEMDLHRLIECRMDKIIKLSREQEFAIALELIQGLKNTIAHYVFHRDIKPENIFISKDEEGNFHPMLADFGLSERGPELGSLLLAGTPSYISPETFDGAFSYRGGRPFTFEQAVATDIFSTGVSLMALAENVAVEPYKMALDNYTAVRGRASSFAERSLAMERIQEEYLALSQQLQRKYGDKWPHTLSHLAWRMMDPDPEKRLNVSELP